MDYYSKKKEEIFEEFKTSDKGLLIDDAKERLEKYGKNVLKKTHRLRPLKILVSQFKSFLIYLLIIAAVISFVIDNLIDGIVISVVVVLNAGIGFFQQYRAEKAIIHLRKLVVHKSKVIREGRLMEIPSEELVVGDIVVLTSGDKINADCRIISCMNLEANEAILTGESLPVEKSCDLLVKDTPLHEQKNMLFTGTNVVRGEAKAVVVSTGSQTVFGKITGTLQEIEIQKTPMQNRLDKFSKQIGVIIIGLGLVVIFIGLIGGEKIADLFVIAVALAVSAIPAGLPAVLVLSFAISSLVISKKNVIIRRLPAVESLGSVTVICSDKTGTLTKEKLSVQKIFVEGNFYDKDEKGIFLNGKEISLDKNKGLFHLLKTSILCNNARFEKAGEEHSIIGDPTEEALLSNALDLGLDKKIMTEEEPRVKKFEFDSKRKMMSVVRKREGVNVMYSKGALERILDVSNFELKNGRVIKLGGSRKAEILESSGVMEKEALRVLGFAYKKIKKGEKMDEKNLIFLGFAGMLDPPRKEVKNAISDCKSAGIKVKMITGDSSVTANAIAKQIGISGKSITEKELDSMSDDRLRNSIDDIAIFARINPEQKLRITKILRERKEVIAITGDGVNDVLALKSADVGVSMGVRGSDVARDVSDIVLMDDNFASIVEGVKQGRKVYDNIKKFTKYFLAVNFDEILLVLVALVMSIPLPLIPLQILWINLITDSLPALSLVAEKGESVMKSKPRKEKSILDGIWRFILVAGFLAFVASFAVYLIGTYYEFSIETIRTMTLTTIIFFELFFVYVCRSNRPLLSIGMFSNKWMNLAVILSAILHIGMIYSPLGSFFSVVPLSFSEWMIILPFSVSGLVLFEIGKYFRNRF